MVSPTAVSEYRRKKEKSKASLLRDEEDHSLKKQLKDLEDDNPLTMNLKS